MKRVVEIFERFQIPLYLLALICGVILGLSLPHIAPAAESAINPILILLLFVTFLGVPLTELTQSWKDRRFLGALILLNFVVVPVVAFLLSRFIVTDESLLIGVLLVLLAPCVDYVIVFSGLAGGAHARLLAAAPVLMLAQMAMIPIFLGVFIGPQLLGSIDLKPFIEAFVLLIVVPLLLAGLTQKMAQHSKLATRIMSISANSMVPLMMLTLAVVVTSQISEVVGVAGKLFTVIPIYIAFLVLMIPIGILVAHLFRQDVPSSRALVFSGATRNSLVVLPLALALPPALSLAAVVVVTQTLVELIGMVIYVRLIPRLIPSQGGSAEAKASRLST